MSETKQEHDYWYGDVPSRKPFERLKDYTQQDNRSNLSPTSIGKSELIFSVPVEDIHFEDDAIIRRIRRSYRGRLRI